MNIFDNLQKVAFGVVSSAMGYNAEWSPLQGGEMKNARVLYKDATDKHSLSDAEFDYEDFQMEYNKGDFEGLKQSSDVGNVETIVIFFTGYSKSFYVQRVKTKFDGKTFVAKLVPVP